MLSSYLVSLIEKSPINLLSYVLLILWIFSLFSLYLIYRQYRVYRNSNYKEELAKITDESTFHKSRLYALDGAAFSIFLNVYDLMKETLIIYNGLIAFMWYSSQDCTQNIELYLIKQFGSSFWISRSSEITCSLIFIMITSVIFFFEDLFKSHYRTFVIEQKHGFNNQTLGFFFKDKIKQLILDLTISLPLSAALIYIIQWGGDYFYLIAFAFVCVIQFILMFIYPEFIAPLFDHYEPFPESALRKKIFDLAEKVQFPLNKLLVVEGSKRSAHSNAYFYGFGKNKRIVIFDTLIKDFIFPGKDEKDSNSNKGCEDIEVEAVLAHELGHWKHGHITIHIIISQINMFLMFLIFSSLINLDQIFTPFGFNTMDTPILLKLYIIQILFMPYSVSFGYLMTHFTRVMEFQADRFAVGLSYGEHLKPALITLQKDNLSFCLNDPLYSAFNHSHPPIIERLEAIDREIEAKKMK